MLLATTLGALVAAGAVCGWDLLVETDTDEGYPTGYLPLWAWLVALAASVVRSILGAKLPPGPSGRWVTIAVVVSFIPVMFVAFLRALGSQGG